MWLIVGLGNVGTRYNGTRHNIGFDVVDAIAKDFPKWAEKPSYFWAKKGDVVLAKPTTFMNLSGKAVLALASLYKIAPENIVVIHDDLDLEVGRVKVKIGGGHAGHNGLKSIDAAIGKEYHRVRIGIGHPRDSAVPEMDVADYVLGKFGGEEKKAIAAAVDDVVANIVPEIIRLR